MSRPSDICQTCGAARSEHGPKLQCPCVTWTHEKGRFITWNKCTFKGLEVVRAEQPQST